MMKIGVTQLVLSGMSLDESLDLCREAGYEAIELVFREGGALDVEMSSSELQEVKQACADAGVEIGSVIASYADRGNMLSLNPAEHEKARRSVVRALEIAHELGAGAILLHPGQLTAEGTYEQAWDGLLRQLRSLAPVAAEHRVVIGLENVWNKFLLSAKEMREFLDTVASNWVGAYLDTANMMAYGYPEHWVRGLGNRIKRVHFKDFKRREHRFVNLMEGDTDWATLIRELRAVGYDSYVVHEVGGDRQAQIDLAERMRRILALGE